mmetsp:Transcript_24092/g.31261  ORF Transcript_24092/g.31261 Transcript_24092/m.31261 type:complete len:323 (-) Transcript_24092:562-1530(-)
MTPQSSRSFGSLFSSLRSISPLSSCSSKNAEIFQYDEIELSSARISEFSVTGKKGKDEDRTHVGLYNLNQAPTIGCADEDGESLCAVAVIDGHGGPGCSNYIKNNLNRIMQEVQSSHTGITDVKLRLSCMASKVLERLEVEFIKFAQDNSDPSGACIVLSLSTERYTCIANLGDCLGVFYTPHGGIQLPSQVHRGVSPAEARRVEKAGGFIDESGRVQGILYPSRCIGDLDVKLAYPGIISVEPTVTLIEVPSPVGPKRPFLLLATDGVWDAFSTKKAAKLVKETLKKHDWDIGSANPAKILVEKSVKLGSNDDSSAAIILF